jgi:hypothetical protein
MVAARRLMAIVGMVLVVGVAGAGELTPEDTVKAYLKALQAGDFNAAYTLVSKDMTQGKSRDEWVKAQQWVVQASEARILSFHVYPGKIEGDKAYVPNLLSSRDKVLNKLGLEENELYTLVREEGHWKVDQQEIVEPSDRGKWFPEATEKKSAD